jgi:hypothetical protein
MIWDMDFELHTSESGTSCAASRTEEISCDLVKN